MIFINLKGALTVTPNIPNSTVIETDYQDALASLEEEVHGDEKVIISGAGNMAFTALKLAFRFNKDAYINGQMLDVVSNKKDTLTKLQRDLVLLSLCVDETMLTEAQYPAIDKLVRSVPARMSKKEALRKISDFAPAIKGATAQITKLFEERLNKRIEKNKDRLFIEADNENIVKLKMPMAEAHKYILQHEGIFVINWRMGSGKTEQVTKKLFELANEAMRALLITSSITLTNALCPEDNIHNYRKALSAGSASRKKLDKLASTMNSALLKEAFKESRDLADLIIFEEYESCRDALTAEIMGNGSLEARVKAQRVFNELLRKKRVVCVDAHFSKQSAEHIIKRTGRKIFLIEPTDFDAKFPLPRIKYNSDRNAAINLLAKSLDDNKVAAAYCDAQHSGKQSKVRSTQIQIENLTKNCLNNVLVDAEFFTRNDNKHYLQDITKLYEEHDLVLSTPATRNGCSSMATCDIVTLLMHQTISPLDVLQTSRRNRLTDLISLNICERWGKEYHTDEVILFETELAKNIKHKAVPGMRAQLINDDAKNDLIARISYNNEMRDDYENNVLDMFSLLGYEIEFDYERACNRAEVEANEAEREEARDDYKLLDSIRKMRHIAEIKDKDEGVRGLREKRVLYASDVYSFYKIDCNDKNFDDVFDYDNDYAGQKYLNNLMLVRSGLDSDYYETASREVVFKKMFEMLNINSSTLKGNFSTQHMNAFKKWVLTAKTDIKGSPDASILKLFQTFILPKFKKSTPPSWMVKQIFKEHFGLNTERAQELKEGRNIETDVVFKNPETGRRERALCIALKDAELINRMYLLAFPYSEEDTEEALEARAQSCLLDLQDDSSYGFDFMPTKSHVSLIDANEVAEMI